MVTNEQLYLAIGVPVVLGLVFQSVMVAFIWSAMKEQFGGMESRFKAIDARFQAIDSRFDSVERRLDAMNTRFDDMRDLWRAELRRVEEVLDARLKHLEERI
jgi:nitrogen fixation-related uncharacterized protein